MGNHGDAWIQTVSYDFNATFLATTEDHLTWWYYASTGTQG